MIVGDLHTRLEEVDGALADSPPDETAWSLRCDRIDLLARLGQIAAAEGEMAEMLDAAQPHDPWYGRVVETSAMLAMLSGEPQRARESFERAIEWERRRGTESGLAQSLSGYAMSLSQLSEVDLAHRALDEAVAIRRQLQEPGPLAGALRRLSGIEFLRGRHRRAAIYAEEAVSLFQEAGHLSGAAVAQYQLGLACSELGDNTRAREALEAALEYDSTSGDAMRATLEQTILAVVEFESGNLRRSLKLFEAAQAAQEEGGLRWYLALTLVNRGVVEHASGSLDAAFETFRHSAAVAQETQNERIRVLASFHEAAVRAALGQAEEAVRAIDGLVPERSDAEVCELLRAMIHMALGEQTKDPVHADRAVEIFGRNAAGDPRVEPVPAHWRIVSQMVEEFIGRRGRSVGVPTLYAASDGSWFRAPGGELVDMSRKRVLKRLFAALLTQRVQRPGVPLDAETLAQAAWPGAEFDHAVANKLYVSISHLRELGLRDVLLSDEGYLLNTAVAVQAEP